MCECVCVYTKGTKVNNCKKHFAYLYEIILNQLIVHWMKFHQNPSKYFVFTGRSLVTGGKVHVWSLACNVNVMPGM